LASLRPSKLRDRFEIGGFLGKTVLFGADVAPDFLDDDSAGVLKSLTGGDPITVELKHANDRPEIFCNFNVIISANSRLIIRLQEDHEAWERRLRVIEFPHRVREDEVIVDLGKMLLETEGPGILNLMLEGLKKLSSAGWLLKTTERQHKIVDDMIHESNSLLRFARDCLMPDGLGVLTVGECYKHYCDYCASRGWTAIERNRFSNEIEQWVEDKFHIRRQNDITGENGKDQRGWHGLTCK
jgi:phage/plasmid-associated DNA primase